MGHLTPRWRRYWGLRPGELRRPLTIIGRGRAMGEPATGPHGRGWLERRGGLLRRRAREEAPAAGPLLEFPLTVVADDDIPARPREHAADAIARVARFAPRPVLHARVALHEQRDPALERPSVVKASLDVSGRVVRAHVAAAHMVEAIDLLEERLRRNLEDLDELDRTRRHETGVADPGEWRHGSLPTARPEYFPRPPEDRELIRRKTYASEPLTPEAAALELQLLDYDFYLFTNVDTGDESVVYRRDDGTLAVTEITPTAQRPRLPFAVDATPAPVLLLEDAVNRLDLSGERFVFFVEPQSRRGHVLYRRYDGHYGLLAPQVTAGG